MSDDPKPPPPTDDAPEEEFNEKETLQFVPKDFLDDAVSEGPPDSIDTNTPPTLEKPEAVAIAEGLVGTEYSIIAEDSRKNEDPALTLRKPTPPTAPSVPAVGEAETELQDEEPEQDELCELENAQTKRMKLAQVRRRQQETPSAGPSGALQQALRDRIASHEPKQDSSATPSEESKAESAEDVAVESAEDVAVESAEESKVESAEDVAAELEAGAGDNHNADQSKSPQSNSGASREETYTGWRSLTHGPRFARARGWLKVAVVLLAIEAVVFALFNTMRSETSSDTSAETQASAPVKATKDKPAATPVPVAPHPEKAGPSASASATPDTTASATATTIDSATPKTDTSSTIPETKKTEAKASTTVAWPPANDKPKSPSTFGKKPRGTWPTKPRRPVKKRAPILPADI